MSEQYQRQTYALGRDGASRLSHAAALVVGMCGVGAETGAFACSHFALASLHLVVALQQKTSCCRGFGSLLCTTTT